MASGRPILFEGSPECEIHRTVREESIGGAVDSGDLEGLLVSIRRLAGDRDRWEALCAQSRAVLDEKFSAQHGVRRYMDALGPWL